MARKPAPRSIERMPKVLSMDLGTTAGWAVNHPSRRGVPLFGTERFDGDYGQKGAGLVTFLERMASEYMPDVIGFEQPADPRFFYGKRKEDDNPQRSNMAAWRILMGMAMVVETFAVQRKIECYEVPWSSWHGSFVGGKSGAKEITQARCHQLGWRTATFDESDACGIWAFLQCHLDPKFSYNVDSTPLFGGKR